MTFIVHITPDDHRLFNKSPEYFQGEIGNHVAALMEYHRRGNVKPKVSVTQFKPDDDGLVVAQIVNGVAV